MLNYTNGLADYNLNYNKYLNSIRKEQTNLIVQLEVWGDYVLQEFSLLSSSKTYYVPFLTTVILTLAASVSAAIFMVCR